MERPEISSVDLEPSTLELDDVDTLIQQLEVQFQGRHVLPSPELMNTNGCTVVTGCTGSCPCEPEPVAPEDGEVK